MSKFGKMGTEKTGSRIFVLSVLGIGSTLIDPLMLVASVDFLYVIKKKEAVSLRRLPPQS